MSFIDAVLGSTSTLFTAGVLVVIAYASSTGRYIGRDCAARTYESKIAA